jgi:hypothetical protein
VRTATARLAQDGWLAARRVGKRSEYRLTEDGRAQFAEATERIYGEAGANWSGRWTLVVLPSLPAAERQRLRRELAWQGYGELSSGVFAHPRAARLGGGIGGRTGIGAPQRRRRPRNGPPVRWCSMRISRRPPRPRSSRKGWDLKALALRYRPS